MIRLIPAVILVALLLTGSGCTGRRQETRDITDTAKENNGIIHDITDTLSSCADSVINTMSVERKAAQFFMPAIYASDDWYTLKKAKEYADMGVAGLILLKGDSNAAAVIADSMATWCEIPPFIAIDAEWGLAMRLKDAPEFPLNSKISPEAGEIAMYDYGYELARECRMLGINMVLGPVLDISSEGSYIGSRSFGNDVERVSDFAVAYARGLESGNVMSVAKHFPGHGAAKGNSHQSKPSIYRSLQSLDSIDLKPFKRYIEQRLSGIMVGHMAFPAIDPDMLPAAVSRTVITDLLREDLGYNGLVLTDAMNMLGAEGYGADKAISAGADIVLAPSDTKKEISRMIKAINDGQLTDEEINTHLQRILTKKYQLDFGNTPNGKVQKKKEEEVIPDGLFIIETHRISRELSNEAHMPR